MTEVDSPAAESALPPGKNRAATIALVAGLLSIIPGVGLIAIVAGLVAGNKARASGGAGRGRAFTAVVLGIGSLFLWAMLIGAILEGRAQMRAAPAVNATKKFIMLVGSGNVGAAKSITTAAIDIGQLTDTAEQFSKWGGFTGEITAYGGKPLSEIDGVQVSYRLPFEKTTQIFTGDWVFEDGQPRLAKYKLSEEEAPATQPAAKK